MLIRTMAVFAHMGALRQICVQEPRLEIATELPLMA